MASSLRKPLIAGNWKMHLGLKQSVELARAVQDGAKGASAEVAICVPFTAIAVVAEAIKGGRLRLGAQDLYWEAQGAFTGEISAGQLIDAGCSHVIIGHSERRRLFGDSDEWINKKLKAALAAKLIPIMCVGETLEERRSEQTFRVLEKQMSAGLQDFSPADLAPLVLAYEPVWAIGTGVTATPAQAQEAHSFLRRQAAKLCGENFASGLRILYGGSVTADNVDNLMAQPDIDGALVGGASLKGPSFTRIANFRIPAQAA